MSFTGGRDLFPTFSYGEAIFHDERDSWNSCSIEVPTGRAAGGESFPPQHPFLLPVAGASASHGVQGPGTAGLDNRRLVSVVRDRGDLPGGRCYTSTLCVGAG